jgi:hypothetical protein
MTVALESKCPNGNLSRTERLGSSLATQRPKNMQPTSPPQRQTATARSRRRVQGGSCFEKFSDRDKGARIDAQSARSAPRPGCQRSEWVVRTAPYGWRERVRSGQDLGADPQADWSATCAFAAVFMVSRVADVRKRLYGVWSATRGHTRGAALAGACPVARTASVAPTLDCGAVSDPLSVSQHHRQKSWQKQITIG